MALIALGINHNTASVDLREKLAFSPTQMEEVLSRPIDLKGVNELAILSTCNRTEIYCQSEIPVGSLIQWIADLKGLETNSVEKVQYHHLGEEAARHMMTVASGLDSLVLGEPQIFGQMKSAYSLAKDSGSLGTKLHDVFQQVFSVAKRVRSETAIGENPVSVAYAAVSLAQQIFSDLKQDTALLIGAGETIELVARHLKEKGIKHLIVANRTLENALKLATIINAEAITLSDIPQSLAKADIVISSTASPLPILGKGAVEQALKKRKHKPMFMVDIAVPRDIESQVAELSDVFLYTVDDLKEVIDENKKSREKAAQIAHEIIDEGVKKYERELRAMSAVNTIKQFRQRIDTIKESELEKSLKSLKSGTNPEDVLNAFARNLSNKIMHVPTARVKKASEEGRHDVYRALQELFDLPSEDPKSSETE